MKPVGIRIAAVAIVLVGSVFVTLLSAELVCQLFPRILLVHVHGNQPGVCLEHVACPRMAASKRPISKRGKNLTHIRDTGGSDDPMTRTE